MNKMAKGAIATAAGVVLLIGGGGTLAVWNVEKESQAGTIQAGNLDLQIEGTGTWTDADGEEIKIISEYLIVPGDSLTYTQPLTLTLDGENLSAELDVMPLEAEKTTFAEKTYSVSDVTLTQGGTSIPTSFTGDFAGTVVASATFTFNSTTGDRDSAEAEYNFSGVGFKLEQQIP